MYIHTKVLPRNVFDGRDLVLLGNFFCENKVNFVFTLVIDSYKSLVPIYE